jgi:hypothetical protein
VTNWWTKITVRNKFSTSYLIRTRKFKMLMCITTWY